MTNEFWYGWTAGVIFVTILNLIGIAWRHLR
jgi:hypothetical protein